MPPVPVMRDVRYETEAQEACDNACERWLRADDQIWLLEWIIVRDPTEGLALTESGKTRAITLQGMISNSAPTVTFVYEVEPDRICVKAALFDEATAIN